MEGKKKVVVWIDQNNDKNENEKYLKDYSKELKDFSFTLATSVKEGYNILSKYNFELIYVILSGRLSEDFLDIYEENLKELTIITKNIIFCYNKKLHSAKKYANDPFYNPGGVVDSFEEVILFLKADNRQQISYNRKEIRGQNREIMSQFIFLPKTIENISFPVILKLFSSKLINDDDLKKLLETLKGYDGLKSIEDMLTNNINLPYYLYAKIFIRIYTGPTPFYRDLNKALLDEEYSFFSQCIFILFSGLYYNVFKDVHKVNLYRCCKISLEDYNEMKKNKIILSRIFMSFTPDFNVAMNFMKIHKSNDDRFKAVLFVVNSLMEDTNSTVTNIDTEKCSFFWCEKEIVFLPFSGFEIFDIKEKNNYTIIYLNYLNKYEKKVKDYIEARSKDKVDEFLKELIIQSQTSILKNILNVRAINSIKNYGNKKIVLWIDQYSRCKVYDDYIKKFSNDLKNFYFERVTTVQEAYLVLSNYEFKFIYIIINYKLSEKFFEQYTQKIKELGVVTANIIFCEEEPEIKHKYVNNSFFNPGKLVTNFAKVVEYLNLDQSGFNKILLLNKSIDSYFTGKTYGNIFKEIKKDQIKSPINAIENLLSKSHNQKSISEFQKFVYKYGNCILSKVVNPTLEKIIDIPLFIYPKFFMRLYGLQSQFFYDINKYLSNHENDFGLYDTYITILYYGLSQNVLISNHEFPFYRGGVISRKEYKYLDDNQGKKIYLSCKNFLSFSRSENEANKFLKNNLGCDNSLFPAKYIINKFEKLGINDIGNLMSNIEMRHYSGFATEQEVLFLPLSVFKLIKTNEETFEGKKIKKISLNYVGMLFK